MSRELKDFINFRIKECSESIPHKECIFYQSAYLSMTFAIEAYRDVLTYLDNEENEFGML